MILDGNGNRIIPVRMIDGQYRACTLSEYCDIGSVGMYLYTGGTTDTYVANAGTTFYHQPSTYGSGQAKTAPGRFTSAKITVMMSVHYSPLSLPTLGVAPGVVAGATDCRYSDGNLDLQRVDAEHAVHNVVQLADGMSLATSYGFDLDMSNSAYHSKNVRIRASAWFFLRATSTGNMAMSFGKVNYRVLAMTSKPAIVDIETCSQTPYVTSAARLDTMYYMVKTSGTTLSQSDPYDPTRPLVIFNPSIIHQPTLEVGFSGDTGTLTLQAMGWGYDVWAYDWVD